MNRKTLLTVGVDPHTDKDALDQIGWYEERKKMSKCIKGKSLSMQKAILKAYEERFLIMDKELH